MKSRRSTLPAPPRARRTPWRVEEPPHLSEEGLEEIVAARQVVPEIQLESARLGSLACRACAWVHATQSRERTGPRTWAMVDGVRTWRGMALFRREAFPPQFIETGGLLYEGAVLDGEQVRQVSAEVFVHTMQRRKQADALIVVEFIGAGNLG